MDTEREGVRAGLAWAGALRATITGPVWHGPALAEVVGGLSAGQASQHPIAGAHSIWELVEHVGAWADIVRERILTGTAEVRPERNFPPVGAVSGPAWSEAVRTMEERYRALAHAVEGLDARALGREMAPGQPTVEVQVRGVIEHGAYHAGQIALLRRALGVEPPPS